MNRQRIFRGLRIAWTVGFGILCLLLIVRWARSYYYEYSLERKTNSRILQIRSKSGRLELWQVKLRNIGRISLQDAQLILDTLSQGRTFVSSPAADKPSNVESKYVLGFRWHRSGSTTIVSTPYWSLVLLFASLAAVPWIQWAKRFSLRTLFIVVTVVAVMLGIGVYFVRQ